MGFLAPAGPRTGAAVPCIGLGVVTFSLLLRQKLIPLRFGLRDLILHPADLRILISVGRTKITQVGLQLIKSFCLFLPSPFAERPDLWTAP